MCAIHRCDICRRPRRGAPAAASITVQSKNRYLPPPCLGEALRRGDLPDLIKENHFQKNKLFSQKYDIIPNIWTEYIGHLYAFSFLPIIR